MLPFFHTQSLTHTHVYIHIYSHAHIHKLLIYFVPVWCVCVSIYICLCVCMLLPFHTHTHTHTHTQQTCTSIYTNLYTEKDLVWWLQTRGTDSHPAPLTLDQCYSKLYVYIYIYFPNLYGCLCIFLCVESM